MCKLLICRAFLLSLTLEINIACPSLVFFFLLGINLVFKIFLCALDLMLLMHELYKNIEQQLETNSKTKFCKLILTNQNILNILFSRYRWLI